MGILCSGPYNVEQPALGPQEDILIKAVKTKHNRIAEEVALMREQVSFMYYLFATLLSTFVTHPLSAL